MSDGRDWAARLGPVSCWTNELGRVPIADGKRLVRELESLGVRSLWMPEGGNLTPGGGRDIFVMASLLLAETERLVIAPSTVSLYSRDATAMSNAQKTLALAFPERFLLGLGVSHRPIVTRRGHDYGPPVTAMQDYLNGIDAARGDAPAWDGARVIAALGPRMLRLSAERAIGANPYFVPVEHTALARRTLGPDALLAVHQAVVLTTDPAVGRAVARRQFEHYLALRNYRANLLRLGWAERELAGGGSDRAIDALVCHGDAAAITERVDAHLAAGADTVSLQVLPIDPAASCLDDWRTIAPVVLK